MCITYSDTKLTFCKVLVTFIQKYTIIYIMELCLPKKYLSYSQLRVWLDDKVAYRDRYYKNIPIQGSKWLNFGAEFARGLEDGTINLPQLPQLEVQEYDVKFQVDHVPFHGWIDQFSPANNKFREIKTGTRKTDGSPRWTDELVKKHIQLDVYSLLIWLKNGAVDDECHLDWIVTKSKTKKVDVMGVTIEVEDRNQLELTGEVFSFRRVITHEERMKAKALILSVAAEISIDYKAWLALRSLKLPDSSSAVSTVLSGL